MWRVYRVFDDKGTLLYVGSTANVLERMRAHRSTAQWHARIYRWTAAPFATRKLALENEARIIRLRQPLFNILQKHPSKEEIQRRKFEQACRRLGLNAKAISDHFRASGRKGARATHKRYTPEERSAQIKRGLARRKGKK